MLHVFNVNTGSFKGYLVASDQLKASRIQDKEYLAEQDET